MVVRVRAGVLPPPINTPEEFMLAGNPPWFPGVDVVGPHQIPTIKATTITALPGEFRAFDKLAQAPDPSVAAVHFYVNDGKLGRLIRNPAKYLVAFAASWGVLTPDFSINSEMPIFRRVMSVWYSRAIGAYYQAHGLRVIPHLRWRDSSDYEYCFLGVQPGSTVAVSNYGSRRDPDLRHHFERGLHELMDRLRPEQVLVYGSIRHRVFRDLGERTRFVSFDSDIDRHHRKAA